MKNMDAESITAKANTIVRPEIQANMTKTNAVSEKRSDELTSKNLSTENIQKLSREDKFSLSDSGLHLKPESQIEVSLSDRDRATIESLERTLEFVQSIPEKLSQQQANFNMRYLESLQDRLKIYQNMGIVADRREYEVIIKEALNIARDALSEAQEILAPKFDSPELIKRLVEGDRQGDKAIITFNRFSIADTRPDN